MNRVKEFELADFGGLGCLVVNTRAQLEYFCRKGVYSEMERQGQQ
jgi:hypothetical protein